MRKIPTGVSQINLPARKIPLRAGKHPFHFCSFAALQWLVPVLVAAAHPSLSIVSHRPHIPSLTHGGQNQEESKESKSEMWARPIRSPSPSKCLGQGRIVPYIIFPCDLVGGSLSRGQFPRLMCFQVRETFLVTKQRFPPPLYFNLLSLVNFTHKLPG